jgi:chemotaxis protein methyltransferase CheR
VVLSTANYRKLARRITAETGIQLPEGKRMMVSGRLQRRTRALGLNSIEEYCELVLSEGAKAQDRTDLIDAVTTNTTEFFREPEHFDLLRQKILPEWRQRSGPGDRMTLWSAACSSGQEPYTLAMVLAEFGAALPGFCYRILATDISKTVLQKARSGIYERRQTERMPRELRSKYLLQAKDAPLVRIVPELRRQVVFHPLNLMDTDYPLAEPFDVIFCRNVFIYFDRPTQAAVAAKLCRYLRPGGYLFIGHSESLVDNQLPLVSIGRSCYLRIAEE